MIIGIDFDGTVVEHAYPDIGPVIPGALEALRLFVRQGHQLILWTARSGETLDQAVAFLKLHDILLFGVNVNRNQASWSDSPKAYCHLYIDDAALGCPLIHSFQKRPYADWPTIMQKFEAII